jgi:8-oxo-dGTP pyrophosphatase MutT (NUDIX family)
MAQKYRIYINDKLVLLTTTLPEHPENYQQLDTETFDLQNFYLNSARLYKARHFFLLCDDAKALLKRIRKSTTVIKAAGGLVKNTEGNYLFIYRNGKWDIPKGKLEKGEKPKEGAVREVEEECGITITKCGKKIISTYHTYSMKGEVVLKKTYWYNMKYRGAEKLKPQVEEGITEVRWFNKTHMDAIKANTFPSIMDVLEKVGLIKDTVTPL